jgi:hypothetical protein
MHVGSIVDPSAIQMKCKVVAVQKAKPEPKLANYETVSEHAAQQYKEELAYKLQKEKALDAWYWFSTSKMGLKEQTLDQKAEAQLKKQKEKAEFKALIESEIKEKCKIIAAEKSKKYDNHGRLRLEAPMTITRKVRKLETEQQFNLFCPFSRPTVKGVINK